MEAVKGRVRTLLLTEKQRLKRKNHE